MHTLRIVLVLMDTLFFAFPAYAYAPAFYLNPPVQAWDDARAKIGDLVYRQMTACFKEQDLEYVINPKTTNSRKAHRLFAYPYRCGVQKIRTFLLRPIRRVTTEGGVDYWILGVGSQLEGEVQFYVAYPADELQ